MVLNPGAENIRKAPSEYLKQVWLDTVSPLAMAIRYGIEFVGSSRMLYASDHPWVDPKMIAARVEGLGLTAAEQGHIFSGNAQRLFRL
jgi:aminocarboxymuconate-semialdehyde decarboxylase